MRAIARIRHAACACCAVLLTSSCATPPTPTPSPAPAPAPAKDAAAEVRALIGDAACSSDAQCRTLPLGARPCGGPDSYVAWSTAGTDERALAAAAERHAAQRRGAAAGGRVASICSLLADPGASCRPVPLERGVARRCMLGSDRP